VTVVSQKEEEGAVLTIEEQEMVEIEIMMKRVEKKRKDERQKDVRKKKKP